MNARTKLGAAAVALLLGAAAGPTASAQANQVQLDGGLGCDVDCVDAYEVKCTQASRFLCITIESENNPGVSAPEVYMSAVATAPSTMLGDAAVKIANDFDGHEKTTCLVRPGSPGTMKALVSIFSRASTSAVDREYEVRAECATGELFDAISTKTVIQRKKNE